jgi:hypothetical protein
VRDAQIHARGMDHADLVIFVNAIPNGAEEQPIVLNVSEVQRLNLVSPGNVFCLFYIFG